MVWVTRIYPCEGLPWNDRMYVRMVITYSESMNPPGKVANPARGPLGNENGYFSVPVRA